MKIGKINIKSIGISGFSSVLTHIPRPPEKLYIAGRLPEDRRPTVAIVGSRKPTPYGIEVTERLAQDLARAGVIVISGLAYGIDSVAHTATLEAGGTTIAILANGLHRIYPSAHTGLAERIVQQGGALVSEHPQGYDARHYDFLARNRLISGLADAIIVVEATARSGTLSTVEHAIEQNKEVFAVPGPITSLLSAGPNRLLQQGAHVALQARDIIEVIAPQLANSAGKQRLLPLGMNKEEQHILDILAMGNQSTDTLLASATSIPEGLRTLTALEVRGAIHPLPGGYWAIKL